jgi:hypothetical protein
LSQRASWRLFITTSIIDSWILGAAWRASIQRLKNNGAQAGMREKLIFSIPVKEVKKPISNIGQSTRDEISYIYSCTKVQRSILHPCFPRIHFDLQKGVVLFLLNQCNIVPLW